MDRIYFTMGIDDVVTDTTSNRKRKEMQMWLSELKVWYDVVEGKWHFKLPDAIPECRVTDFIDSIKAKCGGVTTTTVSKVSCWECGCVHDADDVCPACGERGGNYV